jgi:hypothetical protein
LRAGTGGNCFKVRGKYVKGEWIKYVRGEWIKWRGQDLIRTGRLYSSPYSKND